MLLGLLGGIVGIVLVLETIHLWSDHQALHVVVDYLNQHSAAINKLP